MSRFCVSSVSLCFFSIGVSRHLGMATTAQTTQMRCWLVAQSVLEPPLSPPTALDWWWLVENKDPPVQSRAACREEPAVALPSPQSPVQGCIQQLLPVMFLTVPDRKMRDRLEASGLKSMKHTMDDKCSVLLKMRPAIMGCPLSLFCGQRLHCLGRGQSRMACMPRGPTSIDVAQ